MEGISIPRLPEESEQAYIRFLTYCTIGPARSLVKAYQRYHAEQEGAEGMKRRQVPGNWYRESAAHRWQERALHYDLARLDYISAQITAEFISNLHKANKRLSVALDTFTPSSTDDVIAIIDLLSGYVNAQAVQDAQALVTAWPQD